MAGQGSQAVQGGGALRWGCGGVVQKAQRISVTPCERVGCRLWEAWAHLARCTADIASMRPMR
ncbi:hypothetical protein E2562_020542 [Oryza meyeriana var. granulata]|uniref:Uncharacterized protein n=1 Tax=Oryza meyeriana var. granulata TaxID=110450 RepID=A0A6G1EBU2_9ORYZ|nr:hypothetical protein E2562_020542 [Oryza meyeriana var. granulata]